MVPLSTYRLQLNHLFTFNDVIKHIPYLKKLGISHLYFSPILKAKKESLHGYDVVDHKEINPEIGSPDDFDALITTLKAHNLSLIIDIVPNHIFVGDVTNHWWRDLLQNGPSSLYAEYFDIDWHPNKTMFDQKIFLPLLDEQFGAALENQKIQVQYVEDEFVLQIGSLNLPTSPASWKMILKSLLKKGERTLPFPEMLKKILEMDHPKEALTQFLKENTEANHLLLETLTELNGIKGSSASFNDLEDFLFAQHYRLCFWKVANDEVNYRRFFDIFDYAAIRIEKSQVFEQTHQLILEWIKEGKIQGIRIDHIDGLFDPKEYLEKLHNEKVPYVIIEKILSGSETLREDLKTDGTVGYDFLNHLNALFIRSQSRSKINRFYLNFSALWETPSEVIFKSKRLILKTTLASELNLLARRLDRIAQSGRSSQDFSFESLKDALQDILVFFPVYRSYIRASVNEIHEEDRKYISIAMNRAKKYSGAVDVAVYHFIQTLLLMEFPFTSDEQKKACAHFTQHFQQITGPVMAKGLEDTAFYRYYPLASINEVGGDLNTFGQSIDFFHQKNKERMGHPHSLLATTTHDTKRSEDVRARLNVISEIPQLFEESLRQWSDLNFCLREEGAFIPDGNEEYLLYQTLIGTWPLIKMDKNALEKYTLRIQRYMEKAIKEAKIHQSWVDPSSEYTEQVKRFIDNILNNEPFLEKFNRFIFLIQEMGMLNSLAQIILKSTSIGVPDFYQGNELWDFSLVDPDNRHLVNFTSHQKRLEELENETNPLDACLNSYRDGKIKLYVTKEILQYRKREPKLFTHGNYLPLTIKGPFQDFCIAYLRVYEQKVALVATGRFFTFFMDDFTHFKQDKWDLSTLLELPKEFSTCLFKDLFSQKNVSFENGTLSLSSLFSPLPFAVLEGSFRL